LPSVARKLWKTGKAIVVDIRTLFEYVSHHIPGAVLVPMEHLEVLAHKVRDKDVIVVCEHGNRAFYATYGAPSPMEEGLLHDRRDGLLDVHGLRGDLRYVREREALAEVAGGGQEG